MSYSDSWDRFAEDMFRAAAGSRPTDQAPAGLDQKASIPAAKRKRVIIEWSGK